jgi:hypothetical protein
MIHSTCYSDFSLVSFLWNVERERECGKGAIQTCIGMKMADQRYKPAEEMWGMRLLHLKTIFYMRESSVTADQNISAVIQIFSCGIFYV